MDKRTDWHWQKHYLLGEIISTLTLNIAVAILTARRVYRQADYHGLCVLFDFFAVYLKSSALLSGVKYFCQHTAKYMVFVKQIQILPSPSAAQKICSFPSLPSRSCFIHVDIVKVVPSVSGSITLWGISTAVDWPSNAKIGSSPMSSTVGK